jgi:crotonobetainyl-CoA:carnitine CoA-transferase CaiB-like acyl-CoA transferase
MGADVIKVENPRTDPAVVTSTEYRYRHANKRGASLDLDSEDGLRRLEPYLAWADVLVENADPDARRRWGLDQDLLQARHPHLVHVAMADFGLSGRRAGWRLEPLPALAASGTLHASGFADRPPCWLPGYLAHDCASAYAAIGAVAAMMDRDRRGAGQLVEVSVQEAALAGTTPWALVLQDYLHINPFLPVAGTRNADGTYWVLPAADGYVRTVIGNDKQWNGFVELLGRPEVLSGPEWKEAFYRLSNSDVVRLVASELLADRTRAELFEQARRIGATLGILHSPSEFVAHPQTRTRGVFASTDFPGLDGAPFVQPPLRFSLTPGGVRRPAPAVGEDGQPGDPRRLELAGDDPGLVLSGVRVVEFGMAAVVPEVCLALSELGADVIKIESLAHPDVLRASGMGRINCAFAFNVECRGRRSVAIDLTTPEGRQLALDLCAQADVVAENFRGGVLDDLGLGYQDVKKLNPSVVYVSSQGYGREGPLGRMPAYGPLNLAFAGLQNLWNHRDAPYPCASSLNHPDHVASRVLAFGVMAALDHRRRTGEGQRVDMAQIDLAAFLLGEVYLDGYLQGVDRQAQGNESDRAVPHGVYPAAGEDRWIAIAVVDDAGWARLCDALGWAHRPEWDTLPGRLAGRGAIDAQLAEWTSGQPAEEAAALLQAHGVSAMFVMGPQDHLADAHLADRGYIVTLDHPEVGPERQPGNPMRLSAVAQRTAQSAPCLGAHTVEVLGEVLGIPAPEVQRLVDDGICV